MKQITRTKTVAETKVTHKEVKEVVFVTSDGKEFVDEPLRKGYISIEQQAKNHQDELDRLEALKKLINYQQVNLDLCRHSGSCHFASFTFDWDPEKMKGVNIHAILPHDFTKPENIPTGRCIAIIYFTDHINNNGPDYYFYSGYIGLFENYIHKLEKEVKTAKDIYTNALAVDHLADWKKDREDRDIGR